MGLVAMGKCEPHSQCSDQGDDGGVCPICLQKKLTHVWRGESRSMTYLGDSSTNQATTSGVPRETLAIIGSIASIAKRTQHWKQLPEDMTERSVGTFHDKPSRKPHPSFDVQDAEGVTDHQQVQDIEGVMKDWTALQATRRGKKKKSVTIIADDSPMVEYYSRAGLPLVDRIAKETAMRVIKEVGDDAISVEDFQQEFRQETEGNLKRVEKSVKQQQQQQSEKKSTSGNWHSKIKSKWVKGLVTNSSKVFPSKSVENVQKSQTQPTLARKDRNNFQGKQSSEKRKALMRFDVGPTVIPPVYESGFTSEAVIEGMPDEILKHEDMNQRLMMSYNAVLSWLQDLPSPQTPLFQQIGEPEEVPFLLSPPPEVRNGDIYGEDLAVVGYLHEIVEEHENFESNEEEEEEVSTTNHLTEVSSFGKFLIKAAQRQPTEGLSRVVSAPLQDGDDNQKGFF